MRSLAKIVLPLTVVVSILFLSACPGKPGDQKGGGKKGGGDVPVAVAKVSTRDVPVELQIIGNVEAYSTVTVKPQVTGILQKVHFQEGDFVQKGALLFTIDPAPFQATLMQAEANVARDRAVLEQVRANLNRDIAQQKYQMAQAARFASLYKEGIISKDQAEQMQTNADAVAQAVKADQAAITSAQASVAAGEAGVNNVKIQLGYTSIRSPIDGRTGNLISKEGNLANANQTELIAINQVQPVYVTFSVPEAQLPLIKDYMSRGKLPVSATPPDDPLKPETGTLSFIDNRVDPTTGTIKLKGTFVNSNRKLWPGQFVRVTLRLAVRPGALLVPNQAVQTGQDGPFVYRLRGDMTVEMAKVTTGSRVDQDIVIETGVEEGDTVITEGQLRLSPGMKVRMRGEGGGKKGGKKKG